MRVQVEGVPYTRPQHTTGIQEPHELYELLRHELRDFAMIRKTYHHSEDVRPTFPCIRAPGVPAP